VLHDVAVPGKQAGSIELSPNPCDLAWVADDGALEAGLYANAAAKSRADTIRVAW
jgi:hypothetical protein